MGSLDNKVIVVTGASRGLGESMAIGYAAEGAALVLAARSVDQLESVAQACKDAGAAAVDIVPTDVAVDDEVRALVAKTIASHGRLDVFVANAGISVGALTDQHYREVVSFPLDIVEGIFRTNLFGTFLCLKHAVPAMAEGGSFISISSETGRVLYPGAGMYAVSKAAIDAMSILASRENAQRGVRVNILSPGGMVDTTLFGPNKMPEWLKQQFPPLDAEVIVPAAVWLASDASTGVTGLILSGKTFNAKGADAIRAEHEAAAAAAAAHHRH